MRVSLRDLFSVFAGVHARRGVAGTCGSSCSRATLRVSVSFFQTWNGEKWKEMTVSFSTEVGAPGFGTAWGGEGGNGPLEHWLGFDPLNNCRVGNSRFRDQPKPAGVRPGSQSEGHSLPFAVADGADEAQDGGFPAGRCFLSRFLSVPQRPVLWKGEDIRAGGPHPRLPRNRL